MYVPRLLVYPHAYVVADEDDQTKVRQTRKRTRTRKDLYCTSSVNNQQPTTNRPTERRSRERLGHLRNHLPLRHRQVGARAIPTLPGLLAIGILPALLPRQWALVRLLTAPPALLILILALHLVNVPTDTRLQAMPRRLSSGRTGLIPLLLFQMTHRLRREGLTKALLDLFFLAGAPAAERDEEARGEVGGDRAREDRGGECGRADFPVDAPGGGAEGHLCMIVSSCCYIYADQRRKREKPT
jgi:hypothetical protein